MTHELVDRVSRASVGITPGIPVFGLLLIFGFCIGEGAVQAQDQYRCADGRSFFVDQGEETAEVTYKNEYVRLPRRASGIGVRYASEEATLIIDGDLAAFATDHIVDLHGCRVVPQAEARDPVALPRATGASQ